MNQQDIQSGIDSLVQHITNRQQDDGSWRFGFIEYGTTIDAAMIMLLTTLGLEKHGLIASLSERILNKQQPDGSWIVYTDEPKPNLSATVECYFALLLAGHLPTEPTMIRASKMIKELGGLSKIDSLYTKILLATIGQYPWPRWFPIPLVFLLLPSTSPVHFFQFSGYARAHIVPMLLLANSKPNFMPPHVPSPDFTLSTRDTHQRLQASWESHFAPRILPLIKDWGNTIASLPEASYERATQYAEQFMLDRIEPDGTLYSYCSSTILMIHALRTIGYDTNHPTITKAIHGMETFLLTDYDNNFPTLQNTTSTVWDTSLISHALQTAGIAAEYPSIVKAGQYIIERQQTKLGDWKLQVRHPIPGGWGFSDVNTINPDIDDTTAALRAIRHLTSNSVYKSASNKGLQWLLAMQNSDGGWAAFERNNGNKLFNWLPLDSVEDAATDPSSADLTGRTLEYLGNTAGLNNHLPSIQQAIQWLYNHQEKNGSWYGRWGICYIYGTWAALTGLIATGESIDHPSIVKAKVWLLSIQNKDGGFGESCGSDKNRQYTPLSFSTLSQTAWALDALISSSISPNDSMQHAVQFLLNHILKDGEAAFYPTGAALPGHMYARYDSYSITWPLLALANYRNKFLI